MIANSHPYSQAQQQRCVGIGQQQQNSLYGSNITPTATATTNNSSNIMSHQQQQAAASGNLRSSHMLDLANLHQQNSLFDSAYDDASQINNNSDQISHNVANNKHHNDISLYSPSSSTSLLYHVYDQINVPNDQAQATSNNNHFKRSNTTTILNPANLFGPTMVNNSNSQQQQHQQQLAVPQNMKTTTIPQQELYSSGAQFHLHQPSFSNTLHHHNHNQQQLQQQHQHQQQHNNYSLDNNHQMMLDTILRQQHAATARAQQYHNRPLSSSGASSMSGQSMALTYNRQARNHLPPLPPPINSANKSLANVLQSNQTLNHLGLSSNGHLTPTTIDTRGPKKLAHHQFPSVATSASGTVGMTSRKWKRAQQRVRSVAYEYSTILKCSLLLILLAVCSISIIKFASFNQVNTSYASNQNFLNHQVPSIHSSSFSSNTAQSNMNPLIYPPTKLTDQTNSMAQLPNAQSAELDQNGGMFVSNQASPASAGPTVVAPDVLKSKLVIGEFVILSQNYTNSPAQKSLLFENIVKLMDQVFLSTEVRRVYSRMEITGIRPFRPSGGIVVDCSIVLSESIAYAAQQFGIALYESLTKSNGKLANQPSFIIDKNSIRLNTVPDKDLGIVPPELIPSTFPRTDSTGNFGASGQLTPPGQSNRQPIGSVDFVTNSDGQLQQPPVSEENAVVWSEWSQWSSCVDKNGVCDATRLHSRLRKCVSQHTGDKVDPNQCRQRFNMQDLDLEVDDCAQSCPLQPNGGASGTESHIMSDAPSVILPQTAPPSVMIAGTDRDSPPAFLLPAPLGVHRGLGLKSGSGKLPAQVVDSLGTNSAANRADQGDAYQQSLASSTPMAIVSQSPPVVGSTTEHGLAQPSSQSAINNSDSPVLISAPQLDNQQQQQQQQQQMSCSNCTSDEICLLLVHQKVPFCAKVKDRLDESGCGGWCKAQGQLCQPVGQNAFKCIHDSECLRDEWRCHDSACIPLSKRCDGHSNCYDSSDERDCPSPIPNR